MNLNKLRQAILDDPRIHSYILRPSQIDFYKRLRESYRGNWFGSSEVASFMGISVQSASARLKKLAQLGYLEWSEITSMTGGIEYGYRCKY